MPFLPNKILRHVFFAPALVYVSWLIFDTCPLTAMSSVKLEFDNHFPASIIKRFVYKDVTIEQADLISYFVILLSIIVSSYKLLFACEKRTRGKSY